MSGEARRAVVLGGGVAGIAACFELSDRGLQVELLEGRPRLGGRVFSFADARLDDELDNGPHVMLGCYDHMRRLLRRLGTEGDFVRQPGLTLGYREEGGRRSLLRLSSWPVPLALPLALLRLRGLSPGERARALCGMVASLRLAPPEWTFEEWLHRKRQQGGPRRFLWDPMCRAIMNAEPADISARLFLRTLRRAFGGSARRAAMWIPAKPWSAIVGGPAHAALQRAGVRVALGHRVRGLEIESSRIREIVDAGGGVRVIGDDELVVSAVPWHRLSRLLPAEWVGAEADFGGRAIVNVYFDFGAWAGLPDDGLMTALVDGHPFQFVYRRPGERAGRFALIAEACRELEGASRAAVERLARDQLARYYPDSALPDGGLVRVTIEPRATLLVSPAVTGQRPSPGRHPAIENLLLCGDWTQTQLPSTLEGAAQSGFALNW